MTAKLHIKSRKSKSYLDANFRVPESWTQLIVQEISLLGDSPKEGYLKSEFLSKFVSKDTDPPNVRRQRAISKWLATERDNAATNDRLLLLHEDYNILPRVRLSKFVRIAREFISQVLGDTVPLEALIGTFSGGASTSKLRTESHPASKYIGKADITSDARPWWDLIIEELPGWDQFSEQLEIREVLGNVLFTVPKSTDIDRCACKEPDLNMFLQKGVGNYIRNRLKSFGNNLNDQSRNRDLARLGSRTGSLATIDLSSASDSISRGLVEMLLPPCWFTLLDSIRSKVTIIDGEPHVNEMFSSMGNGFTFELESLLFLALTRSCAYVTNTRGIISVYGDDIIAPSDLYSDLEWILGIFGFSVNAKKSYSSGPFRESCGGHYYNGFDITPIYLKAPIQRLTDLIRLGNQVRRWSDDGLRVLSPELEPLWLLIRDSVPKSLWGGSDLGSIQQLVTPDNSKNFLAEIVKRSDTNVGGYIHWLNLTWNRAYPGDVNTSTRSITRNRYRIRPSRQVNRYTGPVFSLEL